MPDKVVILTTINVPRNLEEWRKHLTDDDIAIVAGDLKTPHDRVREFLSTLPGDNRYLTPAHQHFNFGCTRLSERIGWNSIQRRNVALLQAICTPCNVIFSLDDDNWPEGDNFFSRVQDFMGRDRYLTVSNPSGWWNAGMLCEPEITPRGYPVYARDPSFLGMSSNGMMYQAGKAGVLQSMVLGDPDIDAMERIVTHPNVTSVADNDYGAVMLVDKTWCPFNSQATTYQRVLAPLMAVWPGVGRYDDIWASYFAQKVMQDHGWHVAFGHPLVTQVRNTVTGAYTRNHVTDLEAELFGMKWTPKLCEIIRAADKGSTITESAWKIIEALRVEAAFLPEQTIQFLLNWWDLMESCYP